MESLVLELQRDAYQPDILVSNLIKKAYILARKLQVDDFVEWTKLELNGYDKHEMVPGYRILTGTVKAFNIYNGLHIPVDVESPSLTKEMSTRYIMQSISEIEEHLKNTQGSNNVLISFHPEIEKLIHQSSGVPFPVKLHVQRAALSQILDRVKNIVLEWTLKLEDEGILGEFMSFSQKEKEKAEKISPITHYYTTIEAKNVQLQQNVKNSTQSFTIEEFKIEDLCSLINDLKILQQELSDENKKSELNADIATLEAQANSPAPKKGVIRETLMSAKTIAEDASGSLIATGIQQNIAQILSIFSGS